MKAKDGVVELLNQVLKAELTAVHQYLLHAAMCKNLGYKRLHDHFSHLAHDEVGHSSGLIEHILYLEGAPEVGQLDAIGQGDDVVAFLDSDCAFEREDVDLLRNAVAHCAKAGDFTTRHLLEDMVVDSEAHIEWFETQLRAIKQVGLDRYLAEQIKM